MKISVIVIAHNEEKHIAACLESLLNQTKKADEILLVAHNCADKTIEIAKKFPLGVIDYHGPNGGTHARIEGLKHATGDIILNIDGDSIASNNWVEVMTDTLQSKNNVLVGSYVRFIGPFYARISNWFNYVLCVSTGKRATRWIWGASFAFWRKDKEMVQDFFERSIVYSQQLGLSRTPDDYWLALFMQRRGNIEVTNKTRVSAFAAETTSVQSVHRNYENHRNGALIATFFNSLPHN